MACDMVAALGTSTANRRTFFGHNSGRPENESQRLQRTIGRSYSPGEKVSTGRIELPQARQTHTVLGSQADSMWGYHHGINEMSLAIGCTNLRTKLGGGTAGLTATDLVRLGLERAGSAMQAIDLLTDLLSRYGQVPGNPTQGTDGAFLIVDSREAFVLETSGPFWVLQEVREVRALSDACTIRQDWNRIAPGLAGRVIERSWWPEDGTKIDFAGAVGCAESENSSAPRRWARATYLLQEQNGHVDLAFIRRLLADHYEIEDEEVEDATGSRSEPLPICQHGDRGAEWRTALSFIAELDAAADAVPLAWCAFGPPCSTVYFPIFLAGVLPEPFMRGELEKLSCKLGSRPGDADAGPDQPARSRESLARLQEKFDQEAAEFQNEAREWQRQGNREELERQASLFHQHALESCERLLEGTSPEGRPKTHAAGDLHPVGEMAPAPWA